MDVQTKQPIITSKIKDLISIPYFTSGAFQNIFLHSNSGISITDYEGNILDVNPAFSRITGYSHDEAVGQNPRMLRSDYQDASFYKKLWGSLKKGGFFQAEIWNRRKSGEIFPELLSINRIDIPNSSSKFFVAVFSEVILLGSRKEIVNLSYYDPLTRLANRYLLLEHLNKVKESIDRCEFNEEDSNKSLRDKQIVVFFFDLNKFKPVNDIFGHKCGDELLKEVARRISAITRKMDLFARYGGDEFILVSIMKKGREDAVHTAQKIIEETSRPFLISGNNIQIGASVGMSCYPGDAPDVGALVENADKAMYVAKKSKGKAPFVFFDDIEKKGKLEK